MLKLVIITTLSIFLLACSGEGELKIINRTSHDIYFNINNIDYTLNGSDDLQNPASQSVKLDAGSDFLNTPQKSYHLALEGETFAIYDENQQIDVPATQITIEADKTTSVFCDPNYACLKITNNSSQKVLSAYYIKSYNGNRINIPQAENLPPDSSTYKRLEYSLEIAEEPEDIFYYIFGVTLNDSTQYTFGDENNILYLDDLYHIVLNDSLSGKRVVQ
jgi:hypothetical protein